MSTEQACFEVLFQQGRGYVTLRRGMPLATAKEFAKQTAKQRQHGVWIRNALTGALEHVSSRAE